MTESPGVEKDFDNKSQQIKSLFIHEPEAVFVLSGGIVARGKEGKKHFHSTAYSDDGFGGKARVIAAAETTRYFPDTTVVTTSFVNPNEPTHASVMAEELTKLGVDTKQILQEDQSNSTASELIEMVKLATQRNWKHLAVITSYWHVERVRLMYELLGKSIGGNDAELKTALENFKKSEGDVSFVAAEQVLPIRSPHYAALIEAERKTAAHTERVAREQQGIKSLRDGTYRFR